MEKPASNQKVHLLVNFLYPGIILKGEAFTDKGDKISDANIPLTIELINDLKAKGIQKIYYNRPAFIPKTDTTKPAVEQSVMNEAVNTIQELENAAKVKTNLPQKEIDKVASDFVENISAKDDSVLNLLDLKDFDDYSYTHSINVSIIAIMLAKKLSYTEEGLKVIATAGLLHDIGKTLIPKEILTKTEKLTDEEYEIMKKHPVFGYEIIRAYSSYPSIIQKIVLLHHEKVSGKGYPFGLRGEQMGEGAQIISLANTFDTITTPRDGKSGKPFWYTLTQINKESGVNFAPRLAKTFTKEMPFHLTEGEIFKKGTFVTLNTGEIAEVIDYSFPQTLTPYVNVYINAKKEIVRYPIQINLQYDDTRYIVQVIQDESITAKLSEIKAKLTFKKEEKKDTTKEDVKQAVQEKASTAEAPKDLPVDKIQANKVDPSVLKTDESVLKK